MGVSGCPRSCVESGVKDFGVISVENGYQIYIGGNGGTEVTVGQLLTTVETEDQWYNFVVRLCSITERLEYMLNEQHHGLND